MRQGVKFVRTVAQAFGAAFGNETTPGPGVQTDQQIEAWLISSAASTQFHPSGSCSMLPKSQGGVVNAKLQVYGLGMSQIPRTPN
jgi:choline dehydrogenase